MKRRIIPALGLVCMLALHGLAQTYTISGTVKEGGSQELLPGVSIYDGVSKQGTISNRYGFYSLSLPAGDYLIKYSMLGYEVDSFRLTLNSDITHDVLLQSTDNTLAGVTVQGNRQAPNESQKIQMSSIEVPIEQIRDIPTFLGEKDVLKTIQLLPGVQSGSEGQSGIYVRGGGPDQNLIILDDAVVYNASHLFGFFSIFNGDALKSVELIKGGFPARYGGRLSSVVDMSMKEGNREHYTGELGIGVIASRGVFEGPIPGSNGKGSFIISGRRTYIDALIQPLIWAESGGSEKAGYFFHDFNAKLNYDLTDKDRIYASGYFGKDEFYYGYKDPDFSEDGSLGWGNNTATVRWNRLISKKAFSNLSAVYSTFGLGVNAISKDEDERYELDFGSTIKDYTLKYDLDYYHNSQHTLRTGAVFTYHRFSPNAIVIKGTDFPTLNNESVTKAYETGLYVEDDYQPNNRFKFNLGMRLSHFQQGGKDYINYEPRFSGAYSLNSVSSLKLSYALMNQYIHLLSNTGVGLPTDLWVPATERVLPQRSQQIAFGYARDFEDQGLSLTVESYYKKMDNILGYKEGASFLEPEFDGSSITFGDWQNKVTSGQGESYGLEFFLQKKFGRFSGWTGYTLSWTQLQFDELNGGDWYWAKYDRRHDLSLVGIYKLSDGVKLSGTFVYGTGNAISVPRNQVPGIALGPDFNAGNLVWGTVYDYGDKNSYRMKAYTRMDLGVQFSKKKKYGIRTWEISVYNATNARNPYFVYRRNYDPDEDPFNNNDRVGLFQVSIFPILPSVSYSYKFN